MSQLPMRMPAIIVILSVFKASVGVVLAEAKIDAPLLAAVRKTLHADFSTNEVLRALSDGLWDRDKSALAVSIQRAKASLILVFLRQNNGDYLAVDVSAVENGNFGKLGTVRRADYDRFETVPVQWLQRSDGLFQLVMRTTAWKSGRRYTVSEPLIIKPNGTVLWR